MAMVQPGVLCSPGRGMRHRLLRCTRWLADELLPDFQAEGLPGLMVLSPVWRSPPHPGESCSGRAGELQQLVWDASTRGGLIVFDKFMRS